MAKLIHVDHSLRRIGGHEYDYALHVLTAAEHAGYEPILGTRRKFREHDHLPKTWKVMNVFRHSSYNKYVLRSKGPASLPGASTAVLGETRSASPPEDSLSKRLSNHWYHFRRKLRARAFTLDCQKLFSQVTLDEGDHVFFPTASELDLRGLANFLNGFPEGKVATWHLQFHFSIFRGRPPEYVAQEGFLKDLRASFVSSLQQTVGHRLRFYTTSQALADQYNQLEVGEFRCLPYPINPAIVTESSATATPRPLRVTCAGGVREEKGQHSLRPMLEEVWDDCFMSGRLQLLIQAKPSKQAHLRLSPFRDDASTGTGNMTDSTPIVYLPHPLPMSDYADLIRQAHIGLLMYDSLPYFARRAGVLSEMLCAAVPVIVPAGCWLSEQIAEPGFAYLDQLDAEATEDISNSAVHLPSVRSRHVREDASNALRVGSEENPALTTFAIPRGMRELLVSFRRSSTEPSGTYVRVEVSQMDDRGDVVQQFTHVIGERQDRKPARAMWRVASHARHARLTWSNAYAADCMALTDISMKSLSAEVRPPLSAVGLIAADEQHVGRLLRELADHYEHYRRTALDFSESWRRLHDPRFTLSVLTRGTRVPTTSLRAA